MLLVHFSWALFHLRDPALSITPEAQYGFLSAEDGTNVVGVIVNQKVIGRLGAASVHREAKEHKAIVCRVQVNNSQRVE